MNLSTAFNIFARQALRQGRIPFEIYDPFYSEKNQARLARSIADAEAGKVTVHDLVEEDRLCKRHGRTMPGRAICTGKQNCLQG